MVQEDGYFLKVTMCPNQIAKIPKFLLKETSLANYMLLGNEKEISIIEEVLGVEISGKYCFDWILVYEE